MYQRFTEQVRNWNDVMQNGVTTDDTPETVMAKIARQSIFVKEEANELFDNAKVKNIIEIVDGHLDTRFTNDQVGVYLAALGVDLDAAWVEVCRSNDSKFSSDVVMMGASILDYESKGVEVEMVESPISGTYVLKRVSDGKIMKPLAFSEPDLTKFIPTYMLENYKGE